MITRHLSLSVLVFALFATIVLCDKTKYSELQSIANKLAALASNLPSSDPAQQTDPALAALSADELKRFRSLNLKLNGIALRLTNMLPKLKRDPLRRMKNGKTAIDLINEGYIKLKQLEPQYRLFPNFPHDELKQLEKRLKAFVETEEQVKQDMLASKALHDKVEAKKHKKAKPQGVYGAQCGPGPCCDSIKYRFLPAGTGCTASECVSASQCLGNSEQCPAGVPLADGTACSKGKCLSGVCINEAKLVAATKAENAKKCAEGTCCDVDKGEFKVKGAPCDVPEELCVEPAALCSGESELCEVVNKPDDTLCLKGDKSGICKSGVCEETDDDDYDALEKNANENNAERRRLLAQRRAELKRLKEQKKQRELKHLVRRFGVLLWMNNKLDSLDADMKVANYLDGVTGTPTVQQIFAHHRVPTETNKLWSNYFGVNVDESVYARGVSVANLINPNTTETSNLKSSIVGQSTAMTSSFGFILIAIALVLIVAYFIFGGKKKKNEPKVIY